MNDVENRIKEVIEKLRPYLINDGGDIEFVKFDSGKVYVKVHGACSHCAFIDSTLKDGVEQALISEVKEVTEVVNIDD